MEKRRQRLSRVTERYREVTERRKETDKRLPNRLGSIGKETTDDDTKTGLRRTERDSK